MSFAQARSRPGSRSVTVASSTAGTSPATRRTSRASTSTSGSIRNDDDQCPWGTQLPDGRRTTGAATRALIKAIRAAAPGHVKLIYFNDPVLIGEGLTRWFNGHDDHLHVRYCEASTRSRRTTAERGRPERPRR